MSKPPDATGEDKFYIELLSESEAETVLNIDATVFAKQNKVVQRIGVSEEDWHAVSARDAFGFDKQGLSLIMRERQSGKIVGFVLGHTLGSAKTPSRDTSRELFRKYPLFWDFLTFVIPTTLPYIFWTGFPASVQGRTARCAAGGTLEGYEGHGLGMRLRTEFVNNARRKGYDRVTVETISPATCHIWTKLGFKCFKSKPWQERKQKDGTIPFKGIEGCFAVHELILRRRPLLDALWLMVPIGSAIGLYVLLYLRSWLRKK